LGAIIVFAVLAGPVVVAMSDSVALAVSGVFFVVIGVVLGWYVVSVMGAFMLAASVMK